MNKTPAQILRESMDLINSVQAAPASQVVDEAAEPDYDFTVEIVNPTYNPADEDDAEEIEVGVKASIFGSDRPATFDSPAEYAEVEIEAVYNLHTGQDITTLVSPSDMKRIEQSAVEYFDEQDRQSQEDWAADRAADRDYDY